MLTKTEHLQNSTAKGRHDAENPKLRKPYLS